MLRLMGQRICALRILSVHSSLWNTLAPDWRSAEAEAEKSVVVVGKTPLSIKYAWGEPIITSEGFHLDL